MKVKFGVDAANLLNYLLLKSCSPLDCIFCSYYVFIYKWNSYNAEIW